ncbi:hypothetical protein BD770DRAFT_316863, partial [Pilaira anomala]
MKSSICLSVTFRLLRLTFSGTSSLPRFSSANAFKRASFSLAVSFLLSVSLSSSSSDESGNFSSSSTSIAVATLVTSELSNFIWYKRVYTQQDINKLISLLIEQIPVKDAALKTGINEKSAYRFKSQWQKTGEIPQQKKRGRKMGTVSELTEKHTKFITDIVDECSTATVAGIHELLLKEFPSLSVSPSAVYRHLRTSCALSMKKLEKISSARNSEETLKKRKE